jgi:hypothetical protein
VSLCLSLVSSFTNLSRFAPHYEWSLHNWSESLNPDLKVAAAYHRTSQLLL